MATRILWIEGPANPAPKLLLGLRNEGYQVETVPTGKAALARLPEFCPDLVVVNAASLRSNGQRICRQLKARLNGSPILLIRDRSQPFLEASGADKVLVLPFTARKLLNRIRSLVPEINGKLLHLDDITLDPQSNLLILKDRPPEHLTPKLAALLKLLMQHAGKVLDRKYLFQQVWETDYVEDTRTLDTHISWLRQKIEPDPQRPRRLRTVRGVGYMLEANLPKHRPRRA